MSVTMQSNLLALNVEYSQQINKAGILLAICKVRKTRIEAGPKSPSQLVAQLNSNPSLNNFKINAFIRGFLPLYL